MSLQVGSASAQPPTGFTRRTFLPPPWHEYAACREVDPDAWFPEQRVADSEAGLAWTDAVKVCRSCPVLRYCLDRALYSPEGVPERFGVWAATSPGQRRVLVRAVDTGATDVDELADRFRVESPSLVAREHARGLKISLPKDVWRAAA